MMAESITDAKTAKPQALIRRQLGRFLNALAICMVAVPIFLDMALPVERLPAVARCGQSLENYTLTLGLTFLTVKLIWKVLKAMNDASERYLNPNRRSGSKPLSCKTVGFASQTSTPGRLLKP